jgi:hypothetical protein
MLMFKAPENSAVTEAGMTPQEPAEGTSKSPEGKHHWTRLAITALIMVVVAGMVLFSTRLVISFQALFIPLFVGMTLMIILVSAYFTSRLLTSKSATSTAEHQE